MKFALKPHFLLSFAALLVSVDAACDRQSFLDRCLAQTAAVVQSCNSNTACLCTQLKVQAACYDNCPSDPDAIAKKATIVQTAATDCSGTVALPSANATTPSGSGANGTTPGSGSSSNGAPGSGTNGGGNSNNTAQGSTTANGKSAGSTIAGTEWAGALVVMAVSAGMAVVML